jgi:hypothetical protein
VWNVQRLGWKFAGAAIGMVVPLASIFGAGKRFTRIAARYRQNANVVPDGTNANLPLDAPMQNNPAPTTPTPRSRVPVAHDCGSKATTPVEQPDETPSDHGVSPRVVKQPAGEKVPEVEQDQTNRSPAIGDSEVPGKLPPAPLRPEPSDASVEGRKTSSTKLSFMSRIGIALKSVGTAIGNALKRTALQAQCFILKGLAFFGNRLGGSNIFNAKIRQVNALLGGARQSGDSMRHGNTKFLNGNERGTVHNLPNSRVPNRERTTPEDDSPDDPLAAGRQKLQRLSDSALLLANNNSERPGNEQLLAIGNMGADLVKDPRVTAEEIEAASQKIEVALAEFNDPRTVALGDLELELKAARRCLVGCGDEDLDDAVGELRNLVAQAQAILAAAREQCKVDEVNALTLRIRMSVKKLDSSVIPLRNSLTETITAAEALRRTTNQNARPLALAIDAGRQALENRNATIGELRLIIQRIVDITEPMQREMRELAMGMQASNTELRELLGATATWFAAGSEDLAKLNDLTARVDAFLNGDLNAFDIGVAKNLLKELKARVEELRTINVSVAELRRKCDEGEGIKESCQQHTEAIAKLTSQEDVLRATQEYENSFDPLNSVRHCLEGGFSRVGDIGECLGSVNDEAINRWKNLEEELAKQVAQLTEEMNALKDKCVKLTPISDSANLLCELFRDTGESKGLQRELEKLVDDPNSSIDELKERVAALWCIAREAIVVIKMTSDFAHILDTKVKCALEQLLASESTTNADTAQHAKRLQDADLQSLSAKLGPVPEELSETNGETQVAFADDVIAYFNNALNTLKEAYEIITIAALYTGKNDGE